MKSKIDPEELKLLLEQDKKRGRTDRIAAHFGVKKQKEQLRQEFASGEGIKNLAAKYNVSYRIAWELTEPIRKPPVDDK